MWRTGLLALASLAVLTGSSAAVAQDDLLARARTLFQAVPHAPPTPKGNALTPARVELGKMLYMEPRLSASGLISCNTCHNLGLGGADLQETSTGHAWQRGPRNAPTVLNAVFSLAQFWDGRAPDLAEQAKGPVQASVEMANNPARVVETLRSMPPYVALFGRAFPQAADPVTFDNVARAIEAFEATLITPDAPFDRYLAGETGALDAEQTKGLRLFVERGCAGCHNGVAIGGNGYFPFGLVKRPGADVLPTQDKGRFAITKTASDEYVFKVPSLRNIELTAPYFHSGKVWSLEEAVRVMGTAQLGTAVTDDEARTIVAFLRTLTGRQPKVEYPVLPASTDATPRPVLERAVR